MRGSSFDDAVKGLSTRARSRRRALTLVATALLGATTIAQSRTEAGANPKKKRCKKCGGSFVRHGECRCASATTAHHCRGETSCYCWETIAGNGFCGLLGTFSGCVADAGCPAGETCVMERGAPGCDGNCETSADCGANCGCIRGKFQPTLCAAPCPA